ncbi:MAG: hypothetical protein ACRDZQ_02310 [Acidimicrobiales bacterium]
METERGCQHARRCKLPTRPTPAATSRQIGATGWRTWLRLFRRGHTCTIKAGAKQQAPGTLRNIQEALAPELCRAAAIDRRLLGRRG